MERANGLSEGDKAIIEHIAWQVAAALEKRFDEKIRTHTVGCPNTLEVARLKGGWKVLTVLAAAAAAIGGLAASLFGKH